VPCDVQQNGLCITAHDTVIAAGRQRDANDLAIIQKLLLSSNRVVLFVGEEEVVWC